MLKEALGSSGMYKQAMFEAFEDELKKIGKSTAYLFRDPTPYSERAKVRGAVREGLKAQGQAVGAGKAVGTGGGALLGGALGGLAGYYGGGGKALPAILAGLAGAGAGGAGGYLGGRYLGGKAGEKALKERGVHPVEVEDSARLRQVLRPALQRKGVDLVMGGKTPYSKKDREALQNAILSRVGAPDPAVLKSLGLPVLGKIAKDSSCVDVTLAPPESLEHDQIGAAHVRVDLPENASSKERLQAQQSAERMGMALVEDYTKKRSLGLLLGTLAGAGLGGALGAGVGYKAFGEHDKDMLLGGALGASAGGLAGGGLGEALGAYLGRRKASKATEDVREKMNKEFPGRSSQFIGAVAGSRKNLNNVLNKKYQIDAGLAPSSNNFIAANMMQDAMNKVRAKEGLPPAKVSVSNGNVYLELPREEVYGNASSR